VDFNTLASGRFRGFEKKTLKHMVCAGISPVW